MHYTDILGEIYTNSCITRLIIRDLKQWRAIRGPHETRQNYSCATFSATTRGAGMAHDLSTGYHVHLTAVILYSKANNVKIFSFSTNLDLRRRE
jgi:hypothetical protein